MDIILEYFLMVVYCLLGLMMLMALIGMFLSIFRCLLHDFKEFKNK